MPNEVKTGDPVRNIKTRVAGILDLTDGEAAQFIPYGEKQAVNCRLKDLEPLNQSEYELVAKLVKARAAKKDADDLAKEAASVAAAAEDEMVEYLRKNSLESTKSYDGLGVAVIEGMKVMPSITEENRPAAFAALREMGRGEVIKESVHPSTLSALVSEMLDKGAKIPESISYFLKPKLSLKKK